MTTAADATLSRNHDGDVLLIQPGKPNTIVATVGTPLWFAIVNAAPTTLSPCGATPAERRQYAGVLRHVIECLRSTGRFTDDERETTNKLEDLLVILEAPASGVAVPQNPEEGFMEAFYEMAAMLGIEGAQAKSPEQVYREQVKPALAALKERAENAEAAYLNMREWAEANGLDTTARNAGVSVDRHQVQGAKGTDGRAFPRPPASSAVASGASGSPPGSGARPDGQETAFALPPQEAISVPTGELK